MWYPPHYDDRAARSTRPEHIPDQSTDPNYFKQAAFFFSLYILVWLWCTNTERWIAVRRNDRNCILALCLKHMVDVTFVFSTALFAGLWVMTALLLDIIFDIPSALVVLVVLASLAGLLIHLSLLRMYMRLAGSVIDFAFTSPLEYLWYLYSKYPADDNLEGTNELPPSQNATNHTNEWLVTKSYSAWLQHRKIKSSVTTAPGCKFPLAALPREVIDMVALEVIKEDLQHPEDQPTWINLAKTCHSLYESVNNAAWPLEVHTLGGQGMNELEHIDSLGWYTSIPRKLLSHERRVRRGLENVRDLPQLHYLEGPNPKWLVNLVIPVERLDSVYCHIFMDRIRCAEKKTPRFLLPNLKNLEIRGDSANYDPLVSDWPWFWRMHSWNSAIGENIRTVVTCGARLRPEPIDDMSEDEAIFFCGEDLDGITEGGFWVAVRMLEEIFATMPRLENFEMTQERHEYNLIAQYADADILWGNIIRGFEAVLPENGLRKFQFHQNEVRNQAARILRERKENNGVITRMTAKELTKHHLAHAAALENVS